MDQSSLYYNQDDSSLPSAPCNSFVSSTASYSSYSCSSANSSYLEMPPPPPPSKFVTPRKVTVPFSKMQTPVRQRSESVRMCQSMPRSSSAKSRIYGSMRSSTPVRIRTVLKVQPTYMPQDISSVNSSSMLEDLNKSYGGSSRCLTNGSLNTTLGHDVSLASSRSDMNTVNSSISKGYSIYSSASKKRSSRRSSSLCAKRCRVKRATSKASSRRTVSTDSGCDDGSSTTSSSYNSHRSSGSDRSSSASTDSCIDDTPHYNSTASFSTPLGVRPECVGSEESPLLYRFLKDVEISLSQLNVTSSNEQSTFLSSEDCTFSSDDSTTPVNIQPAVVKKPCVIDPEMYMIKTDQKKTPTPQNPQGRLDFSVLDADWDNSALDATCTTCKSGYYSYTDSSAVSSVDSHIHPNSSVSVFSSSTSSYASSMYSNNTSFVPTEYGNPTIDISSQVSSSSSSRSLCKSSYSCQSGSKKNVTVNSDMTQFMKQPLVKPRVTEVSKDKKKSLSKKLKQVGRYLHKLGGKSAKDQQFKTLAII